VLRRDVEREWTQTRYWNFEALLIPFILFLVRLRESIVAARKGLSG